jgi:hypothetical protein
VSTADWRSTSGGSVGDRDTPPLAWRRHRIQLVGLSVAFIVSRIVFAAVGVRIDMSALTGPYEFWQFLPIPLLKHHLLQSIWYLHSQPPIFNLLTGLLLKLPQGAQQPVAQLAFAALGLVLVIAVFLILIELGVPSWPAAIIAALVMLDPAIVLYENWFFYAYPTAVTMTVGTLCCIRFLRTMRLAWGLGFFWCVTIVVLMNSSFQIEWLLVPVAVIFLAFRPRWRTILVASLPCLLVVGLYTKNEIQFGTFSTSSWIGMNLAPSTTFAAPRPLIKKLIAEGTLTPLAAVTQFGPVSDYVPKYVRVPHTGTPALDDRRSSGGRVPNFNNLAYVQVSALYLHNDLAFIKAEPMRYAIIVSRAVRMSFVPADQFYFLEGPGSDRSKITTWANLYDHAVLWQPSVDTFAGTATELGYPPGFTDVAWGTILVYLVTAFGVPIACWRRRRDRPYVVTMGFLWFSTLWLFVVTNLVELGENNRLRFELGPLPVFAAAAVVVELLRRRNPRPGGHDRASRPPFRPRTVHPVTRSGS